jgi:hypothetical protein
LFGIDVDDADRPSEIEVAPTRARATSRTRDAAVSEAAERDAPLVLREPAVLAHVFSYVSARTRRRAGSSKLR